MEYLGNNTLSNNFFKLSQDLLGVLGFDGYFKYLNPAWEKIVGYSKEELLSKPFLTFIHPEDQKQMEKEIASLSEDKGTPNFENRIICKDGAVKFFEWTNSPYPDEKIIYCIGRDITEHKQAEKKSIQQSLDLKFLNSMAIPLADKYSLEEFSEILIKGLKEHTGAIMAVFSIYDSVRKELSILHFDTDPGLLKTIINIAGEKITKIATPVDAEKYNRIINDKVVQLNSFSEVTFGAIPRGVDKAIRVATGIGQLFAIAHVIEDEIFGTTMIAFKKQQALPSIELLESYAYLMSVSLRRHNAEITLKKSEKKYRDLFLKMMNAFALHEMIFNEKGEPVDYKFLEVNPSWEHIVGIKAEDVINKTIREIMPEIEDVWIQTYGRIVQTGIPEEFEDYNKGTGKYYHIYAYRTEPRKFAVLFNDVTERRLANEELFKAKEKAEESDRLKSAFLANMSHEIRTPMNGILGFISLLQKPELKGEKQKEYIKIIERSGKRMLNTINDIIDISKIESSQVEITRTTFNVNQIMDELYAFFLPEAKNSNLKLKITKKLDDQHARITSDKDKVYSMLTNLIKNAIKYTHSGHIEYGYTLLEKEKQKTLKFYVKDTGIGVPEARLNAIFERFIQAERDDNRIYEGSGLGLAISRAYVEMLGGKIWVESKEGVGSQFYFTLPYQISKT